MDASIDRLRLRQILAICVLALLTFGVVMVQSASMRVTSHDASAHPAGWHWSPEGSKQLLFVGISILTFFVIGRIDYSRLSRPDSSWLRSPILWAFLIAAASCVLVFVPGIGARINGAQRWLKLGPMNVQPSELAKWAVVLFLAHALAQRRFPVERLFRGLIPVLIPVGILCLLVVKEDFGTAALIALAALVMLLAGGAKLRHLLLLSFPAIAAAAFFVLHSTGGYRMRRITSFLNPYANPQGEGYHMIQSLLSFSSGGIFGRGLGNGIQKLGYLPEDTTDFIFSVICEELGLFGAMFVVAMYLGMLYVAWQALRQRRDDFGRMLGFGIGSMIGFQAAINIAVATVSVPPKGLSLPLVSAGGSGLIITCAALGLLFSVIPQRAATEPAEDSENSDAPFRRDPQKKRSPLGRGETRSRPRPYPPAPPPKTATPALR